MRVSGSLVVVVVVVAGLGCAPEPLPQDPVQLERVRSVDFSALVGDGELIGANRDRDGNWAVLVRGRGLIEANDEGVVVAEHAYGDHGFPAGEWRDIVAAGSGRFFLLSDVEGWVWSRDDEEAAVAFCVVPEIGDEPEACSDAHGSFDCRTGYPVDVPVWQQNDGLGFGLSALVAAPRFYDEDRVLVRSFISSYPFGGAPGARVDITDLDLEVRGVDVLVVDAGWRGEFDNGFIAVDEGRVVTFDVDGEVAGSAALDVDEAAGVFVDDDEVYVVDAAAHDVAVYDRADVPGANLPWR